MEASNTRFGSLNVHLDERLREKVRTVTLLYIALLESDHDIVHVGYQISDLIS